MPNHDNLKYTPKRDKTKATKSHWVDASQISRPKYPTPAKSTAIMADAIK